MKRSFALLITLSWLVSSTTARAAGAEYFVACDGRDSKPGNSVEKPFRTIGRAAQVLQPGDTCWIREGVYRETVRVTHSGREDKPITFARYRNERVIVEGSDVVAGPWTEDKRGVWRAKVAAGGPIEAVFCDGRMMIEARWPNCSWEQNWEVERKWALTGKGSKLGVIECSALGASEQDLSGGLLYLKLSKGNNCFTRPVTSHRAGAASLEYDKNGIEGPAWNEDSMPERIRKYGFENNRFFVAARGALDAPGEWWHDAERSELLFIQRADSSSSSSRKRRPRSARVGASATTWPSHSMTGSRCATTPEDPSAPSSGPSKRKRGTLTTTCWSRQAVTRNCSLIRPAMISGPSPAGRSTRPAWRLRELPKERRDVRPPSARSRQARVLGRRARVG